MLDSLRKYKHEICIGVVVFFITTLISKIGNWFISTTPKISSSIVETIFNVFYSSAATQTSSSLIVMIITWIVFLFLCTPIIPFVDELSKFVKMVKIERKLKALRNINSDNNESNEQVFDMVEHIDSIIELAAPKEKSQNSDKNIKEYKRKKLGKIILYGLFAFVFLLELIFIPFPASLCATFEKDVTIICPYVEEKQILQLKSDWILMRSKDDYNAIYEYINSIKEENNLLR